MKSEEQTPTTETIPETPEVTALVPAEVHPVPSSLDDLAAQLDHGIEVIKARAEILATARRAAIQRTHPEDWLLFRDKNTGIQVGYLQDAGCQRLRPIFGISTENVRGPQKILLNDGSGNFCYVYTADGRCALTGERTENIEGGRASTDDFVTRQNPPLQGIQLELAVRKAARANLDGNICRKLAGLGSVPYEELQTLLGGASAERFRRGRGYGTQAERTTQPKPTSVPDAASEPAEPAKPEKRPAPRPYIDGPPEEEEAQDFISDAQRRRLYAIWKSAGWKDQEAKEFLAAKYNIRSTSEVPRKLYQQICREIETGGQH